MNDQWHRNFPISRYLTVKANNSGFPLHGTFELTSRCNFSCKMCYVHSSENNERVKEKELSVDQWVAIAREARECGTLFLLLTGGEVMIRDDFIEIYSKLSTMGFRIVINSNGSMLTNEIFRCFRKYPPARVNISLYGASEETYMNLCGVAAKNRVIENVRKLKQMGISVRTIMTVTPYNCQDMEEIYEFSKKENTLFEVGNYMFPPIRQEGEHCGENAGRFSAEEAGWNQVRWERLRCSEDEFHQKIYKKLKECEEIRENSKGKIAKKGGTIWCQAGRSAYWVTWDGKMRPCGLMTYPEADVFIEGFSSAWKRIHTMTEEIHLPKECLNCENKKICKVCAAMCQSETGHFDTRPEYVCRMAKEIKRGYLEEILISEMEN